MLALIILINVIVCNCKLFDYDNVKVLSSKQKNDFFGYSILLQSGASPTVIVGAPKSYNHVENSTTGSIYRCTLNNNCAEYKFRTFQGVPFHRGSGEFLGASIQGSSNYGGEFFTCAPRFTRAVGVQYYSRGLCFHVLNSAITWIDAVQIEPTRGYDDISVSGFVAYYNAAFAQAGFDITYLNETKELLLGAPGMVVGMGAVIKSNLNTRRNHALSLKYTLQSQVFEVGLDQIVSDSSLNLSYSCKEKMLLTSSMGYSISVGRFMEDRTRLWYVAGAPRGTDLKGKVMLFELRSTSVTPSQQLHGEQIGSYFGASLLVLPKDEGDDLFVGAPMYSRKTWDEGCVYYYRNNKKRELLPPVKLYGRQISGSRFGTTLSNLGNIKSDSNNYIAISAPFERDNIDGVIGAVYLFAISPNGEVGEPDRITPINFDYFDLKSVKGFGLGLSQALDIDNNTHNDFAIGAFKSGQVFILKSHNFYTVDITLNSSILTIFTTTTTFSITHCVQATPIRASSGNSDIFISQLLLEDDRIIYNSNNITKYVMSGQKECWNYTLQFKKNLFNLNSVKIQTLAKFPKTNELFTKDLFIPFSRGCGHNNRCRSDLSLEVEVRDSIVVGETKELELKLTVENQGDTALKVEFNLTLPSYITLPNLRECNVDKNMYTCSITDELTLEKQKIVRLNVENVPPDLDDILIDILVQSLEDDPNLDNNRKSVKIPVMLRNHPFIFSKSVPDGVTYLDNNKQLTKKFNVTHIFNIWNAGPSPVEVGLKLLIPIFQVQNLEVVQINKVEVNFRSEVLECFQMNLSTSAINQDFNSYKYRNKITLANSDDILWISCLENPKNCTKFYCYTGFLHKSSEMVTFTIDLTIDLDLMGKLYGESLFPKNTIAFSSLAIFSNRTDLLQNSAFSLIYGLAVNKSKPTWILIISIIAGILVLTLLIFGLYKCNFFKRQYKHKLLTEQEIQGNTHEMLIEPTDDESL